MYNCDESLLGLLLTLQRLPSCIRVRVEEPSNNEVFARILRDPDGCSPAGSFAASCLFYSTPLPISFQNSPLGRLLRPCGCAYLEAHQPKTTLMYILPPPLKGDESSAIDRADKVKSRRAMVHVCLHLHSCFFIDPSGSWAVFMQMRQHLNICPKQLTWNKPLAPQKPGRVRPSSWVVFLFVCLFFCFHSFEGSQYPGLAFEDQKADCGIVVFTQSHKHLREERQTLWE